MVGALVRTDGVRVLLSADVAISACSPTTACVSEQASGTTTARIVFLGWEPFALAETAGVRWAAPTGPVTPLGPGDSAPLLPGGRLSIGADDYRYEPLDRAAEPVAPRSRRRRRLPDGAIFRAGP